MFQHWESSNASAGGEFGSTAIMSNIFEQQQQSSWYNSAQSSVQIKSEPLELNSQQQHQQMSPVMPQSTVDMLDPFRQLGVFNPLTPPGYSGLLFQSSFLNGNKQHQSQHKNQLTPSKPQDLSKNSMKIDNNNSMTPPIDVTPPKSPPIISEQTPEKEESLNFNGLETQSESLDSYDEDSDDFGDDEDGTVINGEKSKKRKGSNKPRQYKCKQCKQIFHSKQEFWDHTRSHIKPEKMLQCPKCPFVTEYKHHLEYHLRNHSRSKPFQCPHCNYSCVNKSMLNSHLKSHSTVLQYRCIDCNYATKYCHSLKLHLRKYDHKPDIVLNLDGTPNPLPIIDIYGTRRGPKSKATTAKLLAEIEKNQQQNAEVKAQSQQLSPPLTPSTSSLATSTTNSITKTPPSSLLPNAAMMVNMLQNVGNKMSLFPYFHLNLQMFAAQQQQQQQQQMQQQNNIENESDDKCDVMDDEQQSEEVDSNFIELTKSTPIEKKKKRKGKAFKFNEKMDTQSDDGEILMEQQQNCESFSNNKVTSSSVQQACCESTERTTENECKFCGIIFKDNVLFSLHIGYHSLGDDPFKCNMCGMKTDDKIQFFLHIAKFPHS